MPGRQPRMRAAADKMIEVIGEEATRRILVDNPMLLVEK